MANATATQIQQLYIAYFGRPADDGLEYWLNKGITTKDFAENMYLQNEFISINGMLSIQDQVNNLYQNLFARDADDEGLNYWTQQIQTGNLVLASIAVDLIWAVNNNPDSVDDKACLSHRTNAAIAYTAKVKESAAGILAYQPNNIDPWIDGEEFTKAKEYMKEIGCDLTLDICIICNPILPIVNDLEKELSIGTFDLSDNSLALDINDAITNTFLPSDNFF